MLADGPPRAREDRQARPSVRPHGHDPHAGCLHYLRRLGQSRGRTIYKKLDEEYEQRKKEEKAEGKSGWAAYRWKRDLLERMSIAIAKGNWALLDAHTPVRPFGAAA